jgi:trk system potassium uptake protein TrkH
VNTFGWSRALRRLHAAQVLVLSFALAILVGSVLLTLPLAAVGPALSTIDALFMSASAVCVTGLAVVDVGTRLSPFGQGVVLALVQAGGLGIMTFSSLFAMIARGRLSLSAETIIVDTLGRRARSSVLELVRSVFVFTAVIELAGAVILTLAFAGRMPLLPAVWAGVFHSICAFCNAGFSTMSDSLVGYRGHVVLNLTVMALVITGGIGFIVLSELRAAVADLRAARRVRLSVHTRLMLAVTVLLIAAGAVGLWLCERHNALASLPPGEQWLACLFQSVTARTAGFNTLDQSLLTTPALCLTMILMFVGAGSGSCAGGVKVSTVTVLAATFWNRLLARPRVAFLGRTLPDDTVNRAVTIVVGSIAFVAAMAYLLAAVEAPPVPHGQDGGIFIKLLFETVSAFGTVGLSTGITANLASISKLVLVAVMFVGRLGPVTVAVAVSRQRPSGTFEYASENVMVG